MDQISSRWRKPVGCSSKKKKLASQKAMARWSKSKCKNAENSTVIQSSEIPVNVLSSTNSLAGCSTSENKSTRTEIKLGLFESDQNSNEQGPKYTIVHDTMWIDLMKNLPCEQCGKKELTVKTIGEAGYSTKLELSCMSCSIVYGTSFSSPRLSECKKFEINKNMVEAFLNIGKGHSAMEMFSMSLGIPTMDRKTFDKYVMQLFEGNKIVREKLLETAREKVRKVHEMLDSSSNEDVIDIGVSYDGTWHKRGHSSLYCIGCVVDILTGLVIDFEVVSKYCHDCTKTTADLESNTSEYAIWYEGHRNSGACEKNYEGSSGAMEVHAAEKLWKRSVEVCKMRYTVVLSDGDSKTFLNLTKLNLYEGKAIVKEECINHVAKRLGTALRNKVKEWRTKGICLGGKKKGNLTEEIIVKLTNYYRKAIKDNAPDINKMKTAIFASLYHCMSRNDKPHHQKCPSGPESWCFYNRALALGSKIPDHNSMKTKICEDVVSKILPVYQRLASNEILNRCKSGKTQNSNESVHSLIWKYCPKETFVSKKRIEIAATSAISQFNMGCEASLSLKDSEEIRSPTLSIAKRRDKRRLKQSVHRNTSEYKATCRNKKFIKGKKERKQTKKEGLSYAAGSF